MCVHSDNLLCAALAHSGLVAVVIVEVIFNVAMTSITAL